MPLFIFWSNSSLILDLCFSISSKQQQARYIESTDVLLQLFQIYHPSVTVVIFIIAELPLTIKYL